MVLRMRYGKLIFVILLTAMVAVTAIPWFSGSHSERLILATTTSTYDSGLLDYLIPFFEQKYRVRVDVLPKGTGEAIEITKRGDADLVLVHSRTLEEQFVNSEYGIHRVGVMYNDFIIVGPSNDPAGIRGTNATSAFIRIAEAGEKGNVKFISRADKSGTNILELKMWDSIGIEPSHTKYSWYWEAQTGMGFTLRMCNENNAYTLTDRATWLTFKNQLTNLDSLVEKDEILLNPYALILLNPDKYPQRNYKMALAFVKFCISSEGQNLISSFKKEDTTLFMPMARDFEKATRLGFPNQAQEVSWYDSQQ